VGAAIDPNLMAEGSALPPVTAEAARRGRLRVMKRRATALLAAVTTIFIAVTSFGGDATWAGYVQSTAEAAMIGGLADWFAVTALFRHPLGIPIPHTAIVTSRKDAFATTLGEFIQDSFLTPAAVASRLRAAGLISRLADWLVEPAHAERAAEELLGGAVTVTGLLRDDDVHQVIERTVRDRIMAVPAAPLAGRLIERVIGDGHHQRVVDVAVREIETYLDTHRHELRERLGHRSPWWLPGAAEDRIVERLVDGVRALLASLLDDPDHDLRRQLDARLLSFASELRTSPELAERAERLKAELLDQPQMGEWVATAWHDAKTSLRDQANDPDSPLRTRAAAMVVAGGERLRDDPVLTERFEDGIERAVTHVIERFHGEIVSLVRDTISRWDTTETADRLELLLGPDLQFIRINGTVVGAAAGLVLHVVAQLLS
jgi:uncharacterized membrane-anchored protein YjiN (DUF445 family)